MKKFIVLSLLLCSTLSLAQEETTSTNVKKYVPPVLREDDKTQTSERKINVVINEDFISLSFSHSHFLSLCGYYCLFKIFFVDGKSCQKL